MDSTMYVRLPKPLRDALTAYQRKNLLPSEAEAVRVILKQALLSSE